MYLANIREFLGWCSVINFGLLISSVIFVIAFRNKIAAIHGKMFDLDEKEVSKMYFNYLANYKIAIIVLNIIPYFALKIMG